MKITDILGIKHNGLEAIEAKLNGNLIWKSENYVDVEFTTSLFPTNWTKIDSLNYLASNDYGEWKINSSSYASTSSNRVNNAFDGDDSTYAPHEPTSTGGEATGITMIECPCLINPKHIYFVYNRLNDGSLIQGYNEDTGVWEDLFAITKSTTKATIDTDVSTNNFYSKFRVTTLETSTTAQRIIFEFKITSGIVRVEAGSIDTTQKDFSVCPFPTSWTQIDNNNYSATNEQGEWKITSSSWGSSKYVNMAFDNNSSGTSYWQSGTLSSDSASNTVQIECPVYIKPSTISIVHAYCKNTSSIQGYNEETATWEILCNLTPNSTYVKTENLNISTDKFYKKFRVVCYRYSYKNTFARIHEFQITSGTMKEA